MEYSDQQLIPKKHLAAWITILDIAKVPIVAWAHLQAKCHQSTSLWLDACQRVTGKDDDKCRMARMEVVASSNNNHGH
jgi:hypothetical protein